MLDLPGVLSSNPGTHAPALAADSLSRKRHAEFLCYVPVLRNFTSLFFFPVMNRPICAPAKTRMHVGALFIYTYVCMCMCTYIYICRYTCFFLLSLSLSLPLRLCVFFLCVCVCVCVWVGGGAGFGILATLGFWTSEFGSWQIDPVSTC